MLPDNLGEDLDDVTRWTAGELLQLRSLTEEQINGPANLTRAEYLALVGSIDTLARMATGMVAAAGQLQSHPILGRLLG